MYETQRLFLKHPDFSDWEQMYRNIWSRPETARFMLWSVTPNEEAARERMKRTIDYQQDHTAWMVYEKESGQAIGFAGLLEVEPGIFEDTGIALGPDFIGKGYGKEILNLLTKIAREEFGAREFIASCRSENHASRGMILGCGFWFVRWEPRTDPRTNLPYVLEFYRKAL